MIAIENLYCVLCIVFYSSLIEINFKSGEMFLVSGVRVTKSLYRPIARACSSAYCYRTDDNIIKSTTSELEFPEEDVFSFFSKKLLEHGDETAMVRMFKTFYK